MTFTFCVQDRTGTVAQLALESHPVEPIAVNDTGVYSGLSWNGTAVEYQFTVDQVLDAQNFGISTMTPTGTPGNVMQSGWPKHGTIVWATGANINGSPNEYVVTDMHPANAYVTVAEFAQYHGSRGNVFPESPVDAIEHAIVKASDYIDQRYKFKGVKLLQFLTDNPAFDPSIGFIDPWLGLYGFVGGIGMGPGTNMSAWFTPSYTFQRTEWPRQGVVDANGDNSYGVPPVVKNAVCEAAIRVLGGTNLQPDYDPKLVSAGGVLASRSEEVGPIKRSFTYDTKLGLSFFASIPQIDRMLRNSGLLRGGGGRTIIR